MKKLNPKVYVAPSIDGYVESSDIAKHVAEKYNVLYNSVSSDDQTMKGVREYINIYSKQCSEGDRIVSEMEIFEAIMQLKFNKSDGDGDDMGLISITLFILVKCSRRVWLRYLQQFSHMDISLKLFF